MTSLLFDENNPDLKSVVNALDEMLLSADLGSCLDFLNWVQKSKAGKEFVEKNESTMDKYIARVSLRIAHVQSIENFLSLLSDPALLEGANIDGYDVHDVLKGALIRTPSLEQRDEWKKSMLQALFRNPAVLFDKNNGTITLGQWLQQYYVRTENSRDYSLERLAVTSTSDFNNLPQVLQLYIKQWLDAIKYLSLSSVNLESDLEQMTAITDSGLVLHMKDGEVVQLIGNINQPSDLNSARTESVKLETVVEASSSQQDLNSNQTKNGLSIINKQSIIDRKSSLKLKRLSTSQLVQYVHQNVLRRNTEDVLVGLSLLAEMASLEQFVMSKYSSQLLINARSEYNSAQERDIESYGLPVIADTLIVFRHILVSQLSILDTDAAQLVSDLIGIAREKGEKIEHVSYYDESDGHYHWL